MYNHAWCMHSVRTHSVIPMITTLCTHTHSHHALLCLSTRTPSLPTVRGGMAVRVRARTPCLPILPTPVARAPTRRTPAARRAFCAMSPSRALHPRCAGAMNCADTTAAPPSMRRCKWCAVKAKRWFGGSRRSMAPGQASWPGRRQNQQRAARPPRRTRSRTCATSAR
jgi:hypothetical protein